MTAPRPAPDLDSAWRGMRWSVEAGAFALVGFAEAPAAADLAALDAPPAQLVREADETSLLVRAEALDGILARHPDARVERGLRWVRFETPMGWEVVGFLARVGAALAAAGVPIGAVCGYSRDHLFVAERHRARTERVLAELFPAP